MRSIVTFLQFPHPSADCGTKIDPAHTGPYCFRAISPFYSILVSFSCGLKALSLNPQVPEKNYMRNEFTRILVLQSQRCFAPCGPALTGWHAERECAVPSNLRHGEAVHEGRVAIGSLHLPRCHQTPLGGQED